MQIKFYHSTFLIFLITMLPFCAASQQWIQTKGPGGGNVADMIEKNGVILATTLGGIFRSTDNGDTWVRSHTGLPDLASAESFTSIGNTIYAGSYSYGLYRSIDNGITWSEVPVNIGSLFILNIFAAHDTLYLGCEGAGVARSINNGPFQLINTGLPGTSNVASFAQIGEYLFIGLRGNGGSVGIYRSPVNSSITWTQMNTGLINFPSVIDIAVKENDLYVTAQSFSETGIFRSANLAVSWSNVSPPANPFFSFITIYQNDIYAGTYGSGVYKSVNDGTTWNPVNNGLKPLSVFSLLAGSNGLFAGFERGIARTNNNGNEWVLKYRGLTNSSATSLFPVADTLFSTTKTINLGSADGLFFTTDGGDNWTAIDSGLFPSPQASAFVKSGDIFILATRNNGIYIKASSAPAFTQPAGFPSGEIVNALLNTSQVVLAGLSGDGELYRSTDHGLTWTQSNTGFDATQEDQVYSFYERSGTIFAGAFNALYKSTDQGLSWTDASSGIYPGTSIKGITGMGSDLYAVGGNNRGIYKSTDNGASWFNVNNGLPLIIDFNAIISFGGVLYAGSNLGVYRSIDNAASWQEFNDGLLSFRKEVLSFAIHNNSLYAGTDETAVWGHALAPIPVRLMHFNAYAVNNTYIKTDWIVAEEDQVSNYAVERADVGSNRFSVIANVASSNSTLEKANEFIDRDVVANKSYQYRLRIDAVEGASYSPVQIAGIKTNDLRLRITPNPASAYARLFIDGYSGNCRLSIITSLGAIVYDASHIVEANTPITLNVQHYAKGVYTLKAETREGVKLEKFMVK